jgi:hypothetical protein
MVVLAVVVLVVESYQELIQPAVQQVHQDKVTLAVQALEVARAVKQVAVEAALALREVRRLNFTVALAVMVLHHLSQVQALPAVVAAVVEFCKLVTSLRVPAVLAVAVQEALPRVLDHQEQ